MSVVDYQELAKTFYVCTGGLISTTEKFSHTINQRLRSIELFLNEHVTLNINYSNLNMELTSCFELNNRRNNELTIKLFKLDAYCHSVIHKGTLVAIGGFERALEVCIITRCVLLKYLKEAMATNTCLSNKGVDVLNGLYLQMQLLQDSNNILAI